jgi:hypothetical protein
MAALRTSADIFFANPRNVDLFRRYNALMTADSKDSVIKRLNSTIDRMNTPDPAKTESVFPKRPITTIQQVEEDIESVITIEENPYHMPNNCEPNFEQFASKLTQHLAANNFQLAIDQVDRCLTMREAYARAHPLRQSDVGHPTAVAFLRVLRRDLETARDGPPLPPQQVTLYQYLSPEGEDDMLKPLKQPKGPAPRRGAPPPPPLPAKTPKDVRAGKIIYDFKVENAGVRGIDVVDRPFNPNGTGGGDVEADQYEIIKEGRIGHDSEYVAARVAKAAEDAAKAAAAAPGGRRTRRRRAFKRRPKQTRKRMSRRA